MSNDFDKTLLSRLISDELSEDTAERVKKHLQSCEKSRNELAQLRELSISMQSQEELIPPPSIREAFNRDLEDAIKQSLPSNRGERTDLLSNLIQIFSGNGVLQFASVCVIAVSCFLLGNFFNPGIFSNDENSKAFEELKSLLLINSLSYSNPGQRLNALVSFEETEILSTEHRNVLLSILAEDPNVNVRFTALQKLTDHSAQEEIRQAFLDVLENENEPLIQLSLIKILSDAGEERIIPILQRIVRSDWCEDTVKSYALEAKQSLEIRERKAVTQNLI